MATQKTSRKHGRNKIKCQSYRTAGKQEKSKLKRLARHIVRYGSPDRAPGDARKAYDRLTTLMSIVDQRPILARFGISV